MVEIMHLHRPHLVRPHVVILGAGFGGLRAARALAGKPVDVTLVDRNNYHLFQPLLYQVATTTLATDEIAYPVRSTLRGEENLAFQLGEVYSIDLAQKCVRLSSGDLSYDYLIIAVGGETNTFGLNDVEEHGFGLKELDDAVRIRNHLLHQFEIAMNEPDPEARKAMLTFVVVGGGPTGVECAGAISELVRTVLHKDYPQLNVSDVQVILLEAVDRLLAHMPPDLGRITADVLHRKHVDVRFNAQVAGYDGHKITMKDGTVIPANTLVWGAGVRASRLLDRLGLEQDRQGRIMVQPTLQSPQDPHVFVIGDAAHCPDVDGKPLPMLAPVAMQQAHAAGRNIMNHINGKALKNFVYHDPGVMATIGRNQAVALIGGLKFRGFFAWLMWLGVHIYQLIGFRNRLAVLLDWAWSYLFYERAARLIGPE